MYARNKTIFLLTKYRLHQDQYDTDESGTLDREQLKKLMTDMNKGEAPDDSDVDDVFLRADKSKTRALLKSEVVLAASVWSS